MKVHFTILILFMCFIFSSFKIIAQTAEEPAGSGTEGDPYLIAKLENLYWMTQNESEWNKVFLQTAEIDASNTSTWDDGKGFKQIGFQAGSKFTGIYDGGSHTISGLTINRPDEDYIAFFGFTDLPSNEGVVIKNLGLVDVNISGKSHVAALLGKAQANINIINCYSSGTINASSSVAGGLIAFTQRNTDVIDKCYSSCNVTAVWQDVGGLIGSTNASPLTNCYATGNVESTQRWNVGGLAGNYSGEITNCYSTGTVSASFSAGGLIGKMGSGSVTSSYWDTESSGLSESAGGEGKSTAEMKDQATFSGWDFTNIWAIDTEINDDYPYLLGDVTSVENLNKFEDKTACLSRVYPNPFSSILNIEYTLNSSSDISIYITNILGETVENIIASKSHPAGTFNAQWQCSNAKTGTYYIILKSRETITVRKASLMH